MCTVSRQMGPVLVYEVPYLGPEGCRSTMSTQAVLHTCSANLGLVKILYYMVALIFMLCLIAINKGKTYPLSFYLLF